MLRRIYIKNYALIDEIDIEFGQGFTTITGETGAGKSIILGALSLVLGDRADLSKIKEGTQKCIVEAEFDLSQNFDTSFFDSNALDFEKQSLIRREILASGKSRAFINDTPVKLDLLRSLTGSLIDIHSQNENISLNASEYQLELLDDFAGISDLRKDHQKIFQELKELSQSLSALKDELAERIQNRDFWQFQFNELEEADLKEGEEHDLESKLKIISGSEELKSSLYQISAELAEHDHNILSSLRSIESKLVGFKGMTDSIDQLIERISSSRIELEDIHSEIDLLSADVDFDEHELSSTEERLNIINHLLQKHRASDVKELIEIKEDLASKLSSLDDSDDQIKDLEQKINSVEAERSSISRKLKELRTKAKKELEARLVDVLQRISIPEATVNIDVQDVEANPNGEDQVSYLFSANKGQRPQAISKVASGGERSRLMLALRYVLSGTSELPAIVLDEIDTGVSGEVARRVGDLLVEMADRMQVISITHLPQIAAKGTEHKLVYKQDGRSMMKNLSQDERIIEIAQMLSGSDPSQEAQTNARQLLN